MTNLLEQLHAGCDGSLKCQLLHQQAAEALGSMREVVEKCRDRFREYEAHHNADATRHHGNVVLVRTRREKAARNREMAEMCEATLQDIITLTGPNDGASLYAAARAMAEHDWKDELVRDVWAELHPWEQEYYLDHARIARGGTAVRGDWGDWFKGEVDCDGNPLPPFGEDDLIELAVQAALDAGLAVNGKHGVAAARHAARFIFNAICLAQPATSAQRDG